MIKGCIFDLDGVIVDTTGYHYLAWCRLADKLGIEFSEEHNERLKGVSRMASLEILLETGGLSFDSKQKDQLAEQKNKWYLELIQTMDPTAILPGVKEFLLLLSELGIPVALGTASKNAALILKRIGLERAFKSIVDGNLVTRAKPDPEVFLKAASALNLDPGECLVFEDAIAGIEAAHRGGMKCIGVGNREILSNADKVISGFTEADISLLSF